MSEVMARWAEKERGRAMSRSGAKGANGQMELFRGAEGIDDRGVLAGVTGCAYPIAEDLVNRYGSLAEVVTAAERADRGVPVRMRKKLVAMRAAVQSMARESVINRPALASWDAVVTFCRVQLAHLPREEFHLLFLDRKNRLIAHERQNHGTVDHTPVYPREVVKSALAHDCSAVIMVHNHPSGDPAPSKADIEMTRRVKAALAAVDIVLHDHLVIGCSGHSSFVAMGLL